MRKYIFILSVIQIFIFTATSQVHWESIVTGNSTWSYLAATSEPASNWNQPTFDASSWKTGKGSFGYGDSDDSTIVTSCNSLYLRKKFIVNVTVLSKLILDIDYDDAFVLYLNGKEVARSTNITATIPAYNSALTVDHEAKMYQGLKPERYYLNVSDLRTGENTIAVQILNYNASSTDLSAYVFLHSKVKSYGVLYGSTPTWFEPPFESNLPLVLIDTKGQTIVSEPKITATMQVINNPSNVNSPVDTTYEYNGYIGIETRGSSSQMFEKKSFTLETRTDSATNLNVSLMGMPAENDWILYAPYTDKSMIRDALAYNMGNLTGKWSPRTRFCEVFLNGEYRGVYALTERIKIDKNRLNLSKLKTADIAGDQLTGGYLLKIDRPDSGYWVSPFKARNDIQAVPVSYVDPEVKDLSIEQKNYIKDYVTAFETALKADSYKDPIAGYRPYIDVTSFVDYYIINEISRNLDANRVSTFFYKNRDSKGGLLTMGPFWDYNIAFGNADFFSAGNTQGWVVDGVGNGDEYGITFWWDKFRADPYFNGCLRRRWDEMRSTKFSNANLMRIIDSCATVLSSAQVRNYQKFNILSTYVWPNKYIGGTYEKEVSYLKTWITSRLAWMDSQIGLLDAVDIVNSTNGKVEVFTYPNPFSDRFRCNLKLDSPGNVRIKILDLTGKLLYEKSAYFSTGIYETDISYADLHSNGDVFIYQVSIDNETLATGKIMHR